MKLVLHTFLTIDGVMQGPGGAEEDPRDGFEHGGWLVPHAEDMGDVVGDWFAATDAVLLGRYTFEVMKAFWPAVTDPDDVAARVLNEGTKYLVSSTVTDPGWGTTHVLAGDPVREVAALKERDGGELQVHGSAQLASTLHEAGLVDEYRLLTFPVTVGRGKRLFREGAGPSAYELVETRSTSAGAVYTVLRPKPFGAGVVVVEDGRDATVLDPTS